MGQRGPRPKPVALKMLAGNPGKRPGQSSGRGRVRRGTPARPPEVDGEAAVEWDRLVPLLEEAGLLCETDTGVLTAYVFALADLRAARHAITRDGRLLKVKQQTSKGDVVGEKIVPHPACKQLSEATQRVERLSKALGITAEARSRMEGDAPAEQPVGNKVLAIRDRIQAARQGS